VPLQGTSLREGLEQLVAGLSGPLSEYQSHLEWTRNPGQVDVWLSIGSSDGDIGLGADAWRALIGEFVREARWDDHCPLGAHMAAAIGAAEALKRLLEINFGVAEDQRAGDLAFSLLDYRVGAGATPGPDVPAIDLQDLVVAGAGAGGTGALYTLASFPEVGGAIGVVEPNSLKLSNLGRYLMTDYAQVHAPMHKVDSVERFLALHTPKLHVEGKKVVWHAASGRWRTVLATVDTAEARWDIQRSHPEVILDAGVIGTLYAVLRVIPEGWCLECKHPYDPDITWKRRARRWGLSVAEIKRRDAAREPVTHEDIERIADVQGRPIEDLLGLEGVPFDEVPSLTECGETPLALVVPSQAPVLPIATTAAGVALAAEVVKDVTGLGRPLSNYFEHDLRHRPRPDRHRFKPRRPGCQGCSQP
jgi:molybdopterin/thiamine biosynthesis adenylyltransferase